MGTTSPVVTNLDLRGKRCARFAAPVEWDADRRSDQRALEADVDYWVGRLEFGVGYFDTLQAVRRRRRENGNHAETLKLTR
jgi:hypothetical protein